MKITDLHIYGFGQLENVKIENLSDFQVFYGENEAGKSTVMAFIHAMLFGFPTKQQSELRYEPKKGAKYGGSLRLVHTRFGAAVIERVKGKSAAGDVTVTLENGRTGGEELLQELLSHIDKGIFQAIFSFNLHGLQNIHQMKGEEIGRFLFSAGTLGTDRLASAEAELQKELDQRFKVSGKRPVLNERLQELHQVHTDLKKAAAKNQTYESQIHDKETIKEEMAELQRKINRLQKRINKLSEWKKIEAFVKEEKWLAVELTAVGQVVFPSRGMERYEQLNQLIQPYHAQLASLTNRIGHLKAELEEIEPDRAFLEKQQDIQAATDSYPLYHQYALQTKEIETKLSELEGKINGIKEQLYIELTEEEILSLNTNIYMKSQVQSLSKKGVLLDKSKQDLDNRFSEEKHRLEVLEEAIDAAKKKLLSDSERSILQSRAAEGTDRHGVENQLKATREKIAFYQEAFEREKRQNQQKPFQYLLIGALLLFLAFYSWSIEQPFLTAGAVLLLIFTAAFFIKDRLGRKTAAAPDRLKNLYKEEQKWHAYLESPQFERIAMIQDKLSIDLQHREQLQTSLVNLEQQQRLYDKVIDEHEQWEQEAASYKEELGKISLILKIPREMAKLQLQEAFHWIEQLKGLTREKQQLQSQLNSHRKEVEAIETLLRQFAVIYSPGFGGDVAKAAVMLRNKMTEEQEKLIRYREKKDKLLTLEEDRIELLQEISHFQGEMAQLLEEANAKTETAFFEKGEQAAKKAKLEARLEEVMQQLHFCGLSQLEMDSYLQIQNCDEIIREQQEEAEKLRSKLEQMHQQLAAKNHEIQQLEEGGLYSEVLHRFKQKQSELEAGAKEWAVYRLAQDLLVQTVDKYKSDHLPRMLAKAEAHLAFLTDGRYRKIVLHPSKAGFLIEREDHLYFEANELSQATTEQVYVSIRLALATTLYERFQFPIIIDDSFVNFDAKRTQKVVELLKQLKQNQILFFTCHQHLLDYFRKNSILFLYKGAVQPVC